MVSEQNVDIARHDWDAVDLCAGPGGWDVAAQRLGLKVLGFEIDEAAILTRDAVGHHTAIVDCEVTKSTPRGVRGLSMTEVDPRDYFVKAPARAYAFGRGRGGIGSPPCQGFSMAGKGQARQDSERLLKELGEVRTLGDLEELIVSAKSWMSHEGTALVLEPLRWAMAATPSWLAWEQVPAVLPIWEACAEILRRLGYSVVTGNVQAEQYGVPQTRKRAVLLARAPWLVGQLGPVSLPRPTHSRYNSRDPKRLDEGVLPWVSMAEALSTTESFALVSNYGTGGDPAARGERTESQPAATVTSKVDRTKLRFAGAGATSHVTAGQLPREQGLPSHTITGKGTAAWVAERPATTVQGDPRLAAPGHRCMTDDCHPGRRAEPMMTHALRVTQEQAAVLQSFPADYAFKGTKGKVFQQIGNAIPPLLAEALLCAVLDLPFAARLAVAA